MRSRRRSRLCFAILALALWSMLVAAPSAHGETPELRDARMAWWREAKFGMFIHWGLYALPAGEWKGKPVNGAGEWIMELEHIPVADYEKLAGRFNPEKFDAAQWVKIAKAAGMKYIVITSKHHDGFALFDNPAGDYNIVRATPYKKDPLKALSDQCKKAGIKFCVYHSIMDWHHPAQSAGGIAYNPTQMHVGRKDEYVKYMKTQLKELVANYDPAVLWFDGEWCDWWTEADGQDLYQFLRELKPDRVINNRIGKGRKGMEGLSKDEHSAGDFGTPEQQIPPTGLPGVDWESCMTMNDTWGYKTSDQNWKSSTVLIQNLVDIASKGGNFLLNVGPTAEGEIPPASVERLAAIGKWMDANGESIWGTTASPFKSLPWGRATQKPGKIFLHVFNWPQGKLAVPGLKNRIKAAYLLADSKRAPLTVGSALPTNTTQGKVEIALPAQALDAVDSVVVLEIDGPADVEPANLTRQAADGTLTIKAIDVEIHGDTVRYEPGAKDCVGYWTKQEDWVSWPVQIAKPGKFSVELTVACGQGSGGSEYVLSIGAEQLKGKVQDTGSFTNFIVEKLGAVEIKEGGQATVSLKPATKPGLAVMDLKQIVLKPAK